MSAALAAVMLGAVVFAPHAAAGGASEGDDAKGGGDKVTICHRTGSDEHPYKEKRINAKGALKGHARHHAVQAVWSPGMKAKREKWGDIVPAFEVGTQHFAGLNLDAEGGADGHTTGQEILDAHCAVGGSG